jgi:hypothetical protein
VPGRGAARFDEQALFQHALYGAIKGAGAELELARSAGGDVLNDGVAVAVLIGDGE